MKDLILIGAYCPDKERIDLLNNLVDSLINLFICYRDWENNASSLRITAAAVSQSR